MGQDREMIKSQKQGQEAVASEVREDNQEYGILESK